MKLSKTLYGHLLLVDDELIIFLKSLLGIEDLG